ncbi:hypothetical protein FJT64_015621 [Amphibalanus amphitrite]|uniref:Secreted protein n=1 Tax=Amphibalanus amphitrite TaxID=1232801 RepID=A0A6A4XF86_AMPAM|nr:hypothetical protein FJT64_015621 [Amphibalanus amphitrite]
MRARPARPARHLLAAVVLLVTVHEARAIFRHRWLVPNLYFPMIRALDRNANATRKVFGGLSRIFAFLGRRRRSLDSPSVDELGDPCDLRVPCLALKAMDAGTLDQWVEERWPAAAGKWRSQPQLAKLLERLEQLQREELPHSRQLRRRVCQVVLQRCPAS